MYKVSFTGYRPQKLPFRGESDPACADLKRRIYAEIERLYEHGAGEFYTGMALGVDMWCAEAVLKLKSLPGSGEPVELCGPAPLQRDTQPVRPCRVPVSGLHQQLHVRQEPRPH